MVATLSSSASWEAKLDLSFAQRKNKTLLTGKKHTGPLMVQKPFYPEKNGCCHVYLIHPPGGIVGGDSIKLCAYLDNKAHALITTPGATKFYRSIGPVATQDQSIFLEDNAVLEWLPQETVYFNQANASANTKIYLKDNNRFFAWEIQCLGLPAQEDFFTAGLCKQKLEIWQANKPLLLETNRLIGGDNLLDANWGLQNYKAIGTFVTCDDTNIINKEKINQILQQHQGLLSAYTSVNGLFIVRAMSAYAEKIKQLFVALWQYLRPLLLDLESSTPRIWLT